MGAALGLGLAYALIAYLAHQGSIALPLLGRLRIDGTALVWTLLITVSTAVLFGLLPGLKMSGNNLQEALKNAGPNLSDGRKHERLRSALVISEVALACVLLIGAGLLLRSFMHVLDIDLGFQPSTAAAIKVDYDYNAKQEASNAHFEDMLTRIQALPGVEAAESPTIFRSNAIAAGKALISRERVTGPERSGERSSTSSPPDTSLQWECDFTAATSPGRTP